MINIKEQHLHELNQLFESYCPKAEIWAYGSRVNGDSHSGSDLDLVVKSFHEEKKSVAELRRLLNDSDLPFLTDLQEFDKLPVSFQTEIRKGYVQIFPVETAEFRPSESIRSKEIL